MNVDANCIPCIRHLEPTQISMLAAGAPALLSVADGTAWLMSSDGEDILLAVGDCIEAVPHTTPCSSRAPARLLCRTAYRSAAGRRTTPVQPSWK